MNKLLTIFFTLAFLFSMELLACAQGPSADFRNKLILLDKIQRLTRTECCTEAEKLLDSFKNNSDSSGIGVNYDVVARCYEKQGKYSEAERCYKAAVKSEPASIGGPLYIAELGSFYSRRGNYQEGEKLLRQALQLAQNSTDMRAKKYMTEDKGLDSHSHWVNEQRLQRTPYSQVPKIKNQLAICLDDQKRTKEADNLYKQCYLLEPDRTISLEDHAYESSWKDKNPAKAIDLYKRAIALRESAFGKESEYTAYDYSHLAYLYEVQGKHKEAEKLYKQSLASSNKVKTPNHKNYIDMYFAMHEYSRLLEKLGRTDQAKEMDAQAKKIQSRTL